MIPDLEPAPTPDPDLRNVPQEYHDLHQAFRKDLALSLPPHRPYDCTIDLLPGAPLPSKRLYNLSVKERVPMEKYIQESLDAGIIRPSSSPLGAGQKRRFSSPMYWLAWSQPNHH